VFCLAVIFKHEAHIINVSQSTFKEEENLLCKKPKTLQVPSENGYAWQRLSPQISSPSQPYSLREALAQAHSSRMGTSSRAMRESLHPVMRQKLVMLHI
jgi:hypothetical protein